MVKLKKIFIILCCLSLLFSLQLAAKKEPKEEPKNEPKNEQYANVDDIKLCYQTFGNKNKPAFLLISGEGGQGVLWPDEFCTLLANRGFYVIRYDQRDSGYSSAIDFETDPYTLADLADDAMELVDQLGIKKVNLFGIGMGGTVAELMAAEYPERVSSLALMGTEFDLRPYNIAMAGLPQKPGLLSPPNEEFLQKIRKLNLTQATTAEEKVNKLIQKFDLLNGGPVYQKDAESIAGEYIRRALYPENINNYQLAMRRSEKMVLEAPSYIVAPTLVLLGTQDPLVGYDHIEAFARAIPQASCYYIQGGVGHFIEKKSYEFIIERLEENVKRSTKERQKDKGGRMNEPEVVYNGN